MYHIMALVCFIGTGFCRDSRLPDAFTYQSWRDCVSFAQLMNKPDDSEMTFLVARCVREDLN